MTKPLTTLGDALAAKGGDWRADLRAANIPRRTPPPTSRFDRPDRGYVEQPEERVEPAPITPRRRTETPVLEAPVALIRFTREPEPRLETPEMRPPPEPEEPELEPEPDPDWNSPSPEPPAVASPPASAPAPPPTLSPERREQLELQLAAIQQEIAATRPQEPAEMASRGKKRGKYTVVPDDQKLSAVKSIIAGKETRSAVSKRLGVNPTAISKWIARYEESGSVPSKTDTRGDTPKQDQQALVMRILKGPRGEAARVAREQGVSESSVAAWVRRYRVAAARGEQAAPVSRAAPATRTLVSNGAPPSTGDGPPLPTIRVGGFDNPTFELYGLQAWVEHMVRLGVRAELKRRLGDD